MPISSFARVKNNQIVNVVRGPFFGSRIEKEQTKYQRLAEFIASQEIPKIKKSPDGDYLVFSFYGQWGGNVDLEQNILLDLKSGSFNWLNASDQERKLAIESLILRFVISSGGGDFANLFLQDGGFTQISLDIPKFARASNFLESIIAIKLSKILKDRIASFIYYQRTELLEFLDKIKSSLKEQELRQWQILSQFLLAKNIAKVETEFYYEPEKGKRGPKPKERSEIDTVEIEVRDRSVPQKLNYENSLSRPKKVSKPNLNFTLGDFLCAWQWFVKRDKLTVFQQEIYSFMLEYLSVDDLAEWGNAIVTVVEKQDNDVSAMVAIYELLAGFDKTQEIFIVSMLNGKKKTRHNLAEYKPPSFILKMAKILPQHTCYFATFLSLAEKIYRTRLTFDEAAVSIPEKKYTCREAQHLVFNSLVSSNINTVPYYSVSEQLFDNTHLGLLPNTEDGQRVQLDCQRLLQHGLPIHPSIIAAIYS